VGEGGGGGGGVISYDRTKAGSILKFYMEKIRTFMCGAERLLEYNPSTAVCFS
jgi:hypothetical protein